MRLFQKSLTRREQLIAAVVEEWNKLKSQDKPELMVKHPELYFACSRLAAYDTVIDELKKQRRYR